MTATAMATRELLLVEAVNDALHVELARDASVMVLGEDVGRLGGVFRATAGLRDRLNCVFLGTNARSGTARCLIVATGLRTQFGAIAHRLTLRPPETEFDRGLRHFGHLLSTHAILYSWSTMFPSASVSSPLPTSIEKRSGRYGAFFIWCGHVLADALNLLVPRMAASSAGSSTAPRRQKLTRRARHGPAAPYRSP